MHNKVQKTRVLLPHTHHTKQTIPSNVRSKQQTRANDNRAFGERNLARLVAPAQRQGASQSELSVNVRGRR
eukprot:11174976-Lingulodinium_polyedra.AAC.1